MGILRFMILLLLTLVLQGGVAAQEIWPGDIDNNGRVSVIDFLYWGMAYGSTGAERGQQGTDWQGYTPPTLWAQDFPNGVNFAWADADGDGDVDDDDEELCIDENYGLEHGLPTPDGFQNAPFGSAAPRITLEPDVQAVEQGGVVNVSIRIDDSGFPIDSFYGVAFSMTYSTGYIADDDGIEFELLSGTWLDQDGESAEEFFVETGTPGQAALAITRTDQTGVTIGDGEIGTFQIVIEDIIVGLEVDTFAITIDSIRLVGPHLGTVPVIPDTTSFLVASDIDLITKTHEPNSETHITLFPNPTRGSFRFSWDLPVDMVRIVNPLGKTVRSDWRQVAPTHIEVLPIGVSPGVYFLQVEGANKSISKVFIIH